MAGFAQSLLHKTPLGWLGRQYDICMQRKPITTQVVTSAGLWAAGDLLSQKLEGNRRKPDLRRTALTAAFGGCIIGPLGHAWYLGLDAFASVFGMPGSTAFLAAKIVADSTLWNSFYIASFFLWGAVFLEPKGTGGNAAQHWDSYRRQMASEFWPTFCAEAAVWPPIMLAIFKTLPVSHHLLAVNLVTVLDVAFLAAVRSGMLCFRLPELSLKVPDLPELEAQQQQQHLVPALASMHSTTSKTGVRKPRGQVLTQSMRHSPQQLEQEASMQQEHSRLWASLGMGLGQEGSSSTELNADECDAAGVFGGKGSS
mmetsp:Transcript_5145/g.12630  ORF Transcript_5145/g.12630 Transcript_5145/m.12630 type:complete len:312 (-) Transcript_5145:1227-2162(-)|eukprot:CAMPEP_0202865082 /NCGR_PEP_ID=MMETSP1391-20130828/5212_1 /ASSEMBLY_ACC=CAM_ASM_000867 /TAXON_ID=1034604 /ORGANISM="Chlamydomonas leiostraca, Strain SAG 11-49" /LENGTH=311 /DNA_ID=CAMNT_0049544877 /DNA_START=419 /DNA_END=1354 /DNA_ORIENTATION=+